MDEAKGESRPIFCGKDGKWMDELEKHLQTNSQITLLALGNVKYQLLSYLNKRKDIEIVKLEPRHMKKLEKGTGLKAIVRSRKLEIGNIMHKRTEENKLESKQSEKIGKRRKKCGDEKTI